MKTQLLMIIAVMLSSVLTVSQRANAQETSQLRWLEPTVEQRLVEVTVADQANDSDSTFFPSTSIYTKLPQAIESQTSYYSLLAIETVESPSQPRAPPFS